MGKCKYTHQRYYQRSRKTHHHADAPAYRKTGYNGQRNAGVLGPHFEKVFNNHRPIDWKVINKIKQRQTMHELNKPISWAELKTAIVKLANDKATGLNKVPPNVFKSLSNANLAHLLTFFNQYWEGESDFAE